MPDWTIHLGSSILLSRRLDRKRPWLILLGGILPDVISRLQAITLDILRVSWLRNYSFSCFHTPFMLLLISWWIALIYPAESNKESLKNFCYLLLGSWVHLFLDMLEVKMPGFGEYLWFPFSPKAYQIGWLKAHSFWYYLFYGLMLTALIRWLIELFQDPPEPFLSNFKTWKRNLQKASRLKICLWLTLTISISVFPFFASDYFLEHNARYIQFLLNPASWEGKKVSLHVSKVVSLNPTIVEEYPHKFRIITGSPLKIGQWVSLHGLYRNRTIEVSSLEHEWGVASKSWLSLVGLVFVVIGSLASLIISVKEASPDQKHYFGTDS